MRIPVPADKLKPLVAVAYDLSRPQGMGQLHYIPGPLPQEDLDAIDYTKAIHMDYVKGRAVKLSIHADQDGHYIVDNGSWFDHDGLSWDILKGVLSG